jgi:hypothetical protein
VADAVPREHHAEERRLEGKVPPLPRPRYESGGRQVALAERGVEPRSADQESCVRNSINFCLETNPEADIDNPFFGAVVI